MILFISNNAFYPKLYFIQCYYIILTLITLSFFQIYFYLFILDLFVSFSDSVIKVLCYLDILLSEFIRHLVLLLN